ncbi:NB-ARC domain-containing protein [Allokutzneria sp. A3M-2-11 16]|uniref:NB-ARC domain-containing protein n=1 Tax=Allokutzneria sp. A3M-2-11 16 TaxID=2962043 RepID=UPI0020B6F0C8|nr:NB-ARC domain-containing protein [Allokutzneria sp. A3M-2-11 16]MCP3803996.1 NB-ARC domain-containing protein [Allokutzneria sp. A3M-2-11 16]
MSGLRQRGVPAAVNSFVGRDEVLTEVREKLAGNARLVTIAGTAGVGKTRLAEEIARVEFDAGSYPDGVHLMRLGDLADADLLAQTVAGELGLRDQSTRPSLDLLIEHLQTRDMLLVLDNCEHLADAAAELVGTLLLSSPRLRVLATSRQWLDLAAEHVIALKPLAFPDMQLEHPVDSLGEYDAVRLLIDRADADGVAIDRDTIVDAAKLCQRLDGIPLAIELAARLLIAQSLPEVLNRLEKLSPRAASGTRLARNRRRTLEDALSLSYSLCGPDEKRLWARISVFAGGFDWLAAEEVCIGEGIQRDDILPLLADLIRKSIITTEMQDGRTRYRVLDSVRQFGARRLAESNEEQALRQRHFDHYRRMAAADAQEWFGPREVELLVRSWRELPNLRAAIDFCLDTLGEVDASAEIAMNLARLRTWFFAGSLGDARKWLDNALREQTSGSANALSVNTLAMGCWMSIIEGNRGRAEILMRRCDAQVEELLGPLSGKRQLFELAPPAALWAKGSYAFLIDCDTASLEVLTAARDRFHADGNPGDAHMAALFLAMGSAFIGDSREEAQQATAALREEAETAGAQWAITWAVWAQGVAELVHGDPSNAVSLFRTALREQYAIGDRWGPVWAVEALGWTAGALGDHRKAARLLGAAARLQTQTGVTISGLTPLGERRVIAERAAREALAPEDYAAAYNTGRDKDFDQIVAMALSEDEVDAAGNTAAGNAESVLSKSVLATARLIAQGLTNSEIAARRNLSVRTIEDHVNIANARLRVNNRVKIGNWVREHDRQH